MRLTLGEKLKDMRTKRKMTSKQVCEEIKKQFGYSLSVGKYNEMESDVDKDFGYRAFIYLSKFYKVSVDYFLGLAENPSNDPDITNACNVTGLSEIAVYNLCAMKYEDDSIQEVLSYLLEELISVFEGEEEGYNLKGAIYDLTTYFIVPRNENNTFFDITLNGDFGVTGTKFTTSKGTNWKSLCTSCRIESSDIIDKLLFDKLCDSLKKSKTDFDLKKESNNNGKHNPTSE